MSGIYIGNDEFVHASSRNREVRVDNLDAPYFSKRFINGVRVKELEGIYKRREAHDPYDQSKKSTGETDSEGRRHVLEQGGVIGYPTDTIYGVGCDLFNPEAIQKIHRLKKMEGKKPLSFICSDLKDISQYAFVSNYAYKVMKRVLPGSYTFILKATKLVPKIAQTKQKTVGIRIPDNKICLALVKELGHPIISTSVNKPMKDSTTIQPRSKNVLGSTWIWSLTEA